MAYMRAGSQPHLVAVDDGLKVYLLTSTDHPEGRYCAAWFGRWIANGPTLEAAQANGWRALANGNPN
jgi:hypothetical protein